MVIDAFPFFNELDLLEIRLNVLNDVVDFFVIIEAEKTQTLKDKPLYFRENKDRFEKFFHKILHVVIPASECANQNQYPWQMENFQRNYIKKALKTFERSHMITGDSIILISDCDEIPNPKAVKYLSENKDDIHATAFDMQFHAYFINLASPKKGWVGTVATKMETLEFIEPQDLRNVKDSAPRLTNAGWHLSWLGGHEKVYEKFISCIEPFDKNTVPSKEEVRELFENRVIKGGQFHLIDREDNSVPMEVVDVDSVLLTYKDKFPHLWYGN